MFRLMFFALALTFGAGDGLESSILYLSGASCIEELSEDELQRYESLSERPLDLNLASRSRLLSSGLFTPFQTASLLAYRDENGDVLSLNELALVDGFSAEFAAALKPFIVLTSSNAPGHRQDKRFRHSLTVGGSIRQATDTGESEEIEHTQRLRYQASIGERAEFFWTTRTTYSDQDWSLGTISAAYYGRRRLGKIVVGNYSARFGQGLASWSGFIMSSYSSIASFSRNGNGIAPTGSTSADNFGIASEWIFGNWNLSGGYSFSNGSAILNLARNGRNYSLGTTATLECASLHWRVSLPDLSIFGELCSTYLGKASGIAGVVWVPAYGRKYALQLRYYNPVHNKYSGIALGSESFIHVITLDAGIKLQEEAVATPDELWALTQFRGLAVLKPKIRLGAYTLSPQLRVSERYRPGDNAPLRSDLRADLMVEVQGWQLGGRYNVVWCKDFAWLAYIQTGRKTERYSISLRGGIFRVDNWDDRIYVYQQDAPGTFNVPAFYGRGWNLSLYAALHLNKCHSIWLRAETLHYPMNPTPKAGRWELKLQYRWKLT